MSTNWEDWLSFIRVSTAKAAADELFQFGIDEVAEHEATKREIPGKHRLSRLQHLRRTGGKLCGVLILILFTPSSLFLAAYFHPDALEAQKRTEAWVDVFVWGIIAVVSAGTAIYLYWDAYSKEGLRKSLSHLPGWCFSGLSIAMIFGARGHYAEANGEHYERWYFCMAFAIIAYVALLFFSSVMIESVSSKRKGEALLMVIICAGCSLIARLFMNGTDASSELAWMITVCVLFIGVTVGIISACVKEEETRTEPDISSIIRANLDLGNSPFKISEALNKILEANGSILSFSEYPNSIYFYLSTQGSRMRTFEFTK